MDVKKWEVRVVHQPVQNLINELVDRGHAKTRNILAVTRALDPEFSDAILIGNHENKNNLNRAMHLCDILNCADRDAIMEAASVA